LDALGKKNNHNCASPIYLVGRTCRFSTPWPRVNVGPCPSGFPWARWVCPPIPQDLVSKTGYLSGPTNIELVWHYIIQFRGDFVLNSRNGWPPHRTILDIVTKSN
jgi:hypothetical protein